jgi:hypothetical protein
MDTIWEDKGDEMMDIARERLAAAQAEDEADAVAAAQLQTLKDRLAETKKAIARRSRARRRYFTAAIVLFVISGFVVLAFAHRFDVPLWLYMWAGILYAFMFLAGVLISADHSLEHDAQELEDEIDLRQMGSASLEQKAHKLLRIQQHQLSVYLEQILEQGRVIFVVGIGAMLVGVGVVMFTIWETANMVTVDVWQKAVVASVGAIGAILTNYVAVIYLKMFSDVGSAVQKTVNSLSQSTNLNFANVLIANITSEEARNETLKQFAVAIARPSQS